jgi:hypothetical protein
MTTQTMKLMTLGLCGNKSATHPAGTLGKGRLAVLKGLGGSTLRCTSGTLWVTIEGDLKDYVLTQNQSLPIPNLGKVVLTGCGDFQGYQSA